MPNIRKTRTASGATAIQAVTYLNRKMVILKHFGSAKTKEELDALVKDAQEWIKEYTGQLSLFTEKREGRVLHLGIHRCAGIRYSCAYVVLTEMLSRLGFSVLDNCLLLDLVIMRIIEPTSKSLSLELLDRYFSITYSERTLYRQLRQLPSPKGEGLT